MWQWLNQRVHVLHVMVLLFLLGNTLELLIKLIGVHLESVQIFMFGDIVGAGLLIIAYGGVIVLTGTVEESSYFNLVHRIVFGTWQTKK